MSNWISLLNDAQNTYRQLKLRRDDGIGKRTRLESEGGKTHARSERALSAKLYIDNAFNFVADGELKPVRLMFQRQPYIRMGSKSPKPTNV